MSDTAIIKPNRAAARLVGVIASPAALRRALRLRRTPDFFELRLDALRESLGEVVRAIPKLHTPLIVTARHPAEGGLGGLNTSARRDLLLRFLEHAAVVDLELRSVNQMAALVQELRQRRVPVIISRHYLQRMPPRAELLRLTRSAVPWRPDILKIVTRTDDPPQLARLLAFFLEQNHNPLPLAAMGTGKLGLASRLQLDRLGSALTYVSIGQQIVEGQPSLSRLRCARRAYIR
ncbi:MAG: type I 3-dehydroquinate dehydratase [Spartobacteria bacterium]